MLNSLEELEPSKKIINLVEIRERDCKDYRGWAQPSPAKKIIMITKIIKVYVSYRLSPL